jgi:hypothetical protein
MKGSFPAMFALRDVRARQTNAVALDTLQVKPKRVA